MDNTNLNNLKALKKCRKMETLLLLLIVFPTAVSLAFAIIAIFSPVYSDFAIIISIILRLVYIVMAFVGLYCKKLHWTIFAPIASAIIWIVTKGTAEVLMVFFALLTAILTVYNNRVYAYLEQQEGFPYFNERFERQKVNYDKFSEKDPFEASSEERRKTATDKMEDLF